ncbi:hypothetical protein, partial [Pseudomonas fluorescens]|uniref:hypothetical protein n=1 Tax=Pseudomonas fluorescens TaxID=294 RepID=UPI001CD5AEF5
WRSLRSFRRIPPSPGSKDRSLRQLLRAPTTLQGHAVGVGAGGACDLFGGYHHRQDQKIAACGSSYGQCSSLKRSSLAIQLQVAAMGRFCVVYLKRHAQKLNRRQNATI